MAMVAFIIFFFVFGAVNQNTTSSRQLYAFARDGGLPCSAWVSYVRILPTALRRDSTNRALPSQGLTHPKYPHQRCSNKLDHCLWLICILLGSTAAFLNINTIGNSGLLVSYIISISCLLHHRNTVGPYGTLSRAPPFFLGKIGGKLSTPLQSCSWSALSSRTCSLQRLIQRSRQ